jgi:hypothetical protein
MTARTKTAAKTPLAGSLAGSLAEPVGGGYAVRPGTPDGPEYFEPTLRGQWAAIERAGWLSVGGPAQQVAVLRPRHQPHVFYAFADGGACILRPECVFPARKLTAVQES